MWELINQIIKHPIFSILCGLVGFLLGNRLAIGRDKRNDFNKAADVFRNAFNETLLLLNPQSFIDKQGEDTYSKLRKTIVQQEKAALEFSQILSKRKRKAFDRVWKEYCYDDNNQNTKSLVKYASHGSAIKNQKARTVAFDRINKLMEFAKPK